MTRSTSYRPPKVWDPVTRVGGKWAATNRPVAGPTHHQELPVGQHPLQLYSLGTPNGMKVTIMLEELLGAGHSEAEYDAWFVDIEKGHQFGTGFLAINPNGKIPALLDRRGDPPVRVFESGAILLYLADQFQAFIPGEVRGRTECLNWVFWQMASTPYLGTFGHFYRYAPEPMEYPINRHAMEVKRQLDVLDRNLAEREYMCGSAYTIADLAIWPWYGRLVMDSEHENLYQAGTFLDVESYRHLARWAREIHQRSGVQRGASVNRVSGSIAGALRERHHASDFDSLRSESDQ